MPFQLNFVHLQLPAIEREALQGLQLKKVSRKIALLQRRSSMSDTDNQKTTLLECEIASIHCLTL